MLLLDALDRADPGNPEAVALARGRFVEKCVVGRDGIERHAAVRDCLDQRHQIHDLRVPAMLPGARLLDQLTVPLREEEIFPRMLKITQLVPETIFTRIRAHDSPASCRRGIDATSPRVQTRRRSRVRREER
ncbi:hypothetical protein K2Z84_07765 [Candidatus Binatia bacterium]|nr:hypothetical protein [Candidatus Binatia bacterium]